MSGADEDRVSGMAAALESVAMGRLSAADQGPDQPDMLGGDAVGAGPMDEPLAKLGGAMFGTPRRGGGRPKGAKNLSTEAWRSFFLSQRRDPALVLGDLYSMPVEEMAARLGCDRLDAIKVQMRAAEILMPYLHAKQPLAIKNADANLPTLHLVMPAAMAVTASGGDDRAVEVLDLFASEIQQNQRVSAVGADAVGTSELVRDGISQQDQGLASCPPGIISLAVGGAGSMASDLIARDTSGEQAPGRMQGGATPPDGAATGCPPPDTELDEV